MPFRMKWLGAIVRVVYPSRQTFWLSNFRIKGDATAISIIIDNPSPKELKNDYYNERGTTKLSVNLCAHYICEQRYRRNLQF